VTLPNQEIDLIHYKSSNAHIFINSLRIHLKLKTWSILCIYLMSGPLLCSYNTFPGLSFLLPDFKGFESSNSSHTVYTGNGAQGPRPVTPGERCAGSNVTCDTVEQVRRKLLFEAILRRIRGVTHMRRLECDR
jgi:hypothetical protein